MLSMQVVLLKPVIFLISRLPQTDSVEIRTKADVEVANFVSGGIDSTAIAKNLFDNGISINSFSVSFLNSNYDESNWSQKVSETYKTNHNQVPDIATL